MPVPPTEEAPDWPPGRRGAWLDAHAGVWRFALFSAHATSVELLLFSREDARVPTLSRHAHRVGELWRAEVGVHELNRADVYGYRVDGPPPRTAGWGKFDRSKLLLDPYALEVWFPPAYVRDDARVPGRDTLGSAPLAVLRERHRAASSPAPVLAQHARVVMEMHVRGASVSPTSPVDPARRGTFAGLIDLLPHWADLGVTVIQLMPIHQSDPQEGSYWGYMPLAFGAVEARYAGGVQSHQARAEEELAAFVAAAHRAGIHVWVDVVLNHTTEEDDQGPTLSQRGIDRQSYYLLHPDGTDVDDAGCGNVVQAAHPEVTALLLESLDRLVDVGVDGFRFDLASLLARDPTGESPGGAIPAITLWAAQRSVELVAEPWDLARYELGEGFAGRTWAQWNGRFRDDVRSFLRGDDGYVPALVQRVQGSPDLFGPEPWRSVNFVTAHDGFTLHDLFAYDRKHNDANGWGGRDGTDDNRSWNCGHEGDEGAPAEVLALRQRQVRNALCLLLLSAGVPMLVAGDEMGHTQGGNNNPYNQDNPTTWLDWRRLRSNAQLHRFVRGLLALRAATPSIGRTLPWGKLVRFHGVDGPPDLSFHSHSLAWSLSGEADRCQSLYVIANAWWHPLEFTIHDQGPWARAVDTSLPSPHDICAPGDRPPAGDRYTVGPRSVVVLTRPAAP